MAVPGLPVLLPSDVNVSLTVGAIVVATWSSVFMFGMVVAAGYIYYIAFPHDRLVIKLLVTFCIALSGLDTVSNGVWSYNSLVDLWGSVPGAGYLPHLFYVNAVCGGVATLTVQCFYATRIWRLGAGNILYSGLIVLCSILQLAFVIYVVATWGKSVLISDVHTAVLPVAYGWGIAGLFGDILITGALVRHIYRKDDGIVNVHLRSTVGGVLSQLVQTNVLSLVSQIMTLVFFKAHAGLYFMLNDVVLAKIYCFSLLISLNARRSDSAVFTGEVSHLASSHRSGIALKGLSAWVSLLCLYYLIRQFSGAPGTSRGVRVTETVEISSDNEWNILSASKQAEVHAARAV
ncbi:hypothetical protein BKA62DRAFT_619017 [Auriculariales sp. MPI-PUGE-AT-0066]|nr:hypothetical protein BKA62DRAFT_619017 [Auriculariales sp. MPI-PUGE-AT-0066]